MTDILRPAKVPGATEAELQPRVNGHGFDLMARGISDMALATNEDSVAGANGTGANGAGVKSRLLIAAAVGGLLVLVSALWVIPALTSLGEAAEEGTQEPREAPSSALQMKVMKPLPGKERVTTQPATLQAFEFVELYAQATGILDKQDVDIDSVVKKGDLLAEIRAPDLVADRAQAYAGWKKSKAEKVQAEKEVDVVQADLEAAKQRVKQREAEKNAADSYLKFRKAEFDRYKELALSKSIEARIVDEESDRFDSALFRRDGAAAAEQTANLDVLAKKSKLLKARSDVDEAEAAVDLAKAQLDKADALLSFTKVIAPFGGVITQRNYNNGAFIRTAERGGQNPLLVLKHLDKMRVIVQLPDTDVPFVSKGDPAELVIATVRPKPFIGKVCRTAGSENLKSRTMRVEIDLDNKDRILRDGMYGYITIHLTQAPKPKFMLPSGAVHQDLETRERYVYVIRQKRAYKVVIQVGPDDGKLIGIMSGLNANDLVVIQDNGLLQEGSEVEPELAVPAQTPRGKDAG
jgi:HlyD family secretion protein